MEETETVGKCAWYHNINKAVKIVVVIIIINLVVLAALVVAVIYFIAAKKACLYENPSRNAEN